MNFDEAMKHYWPRGWFRLRFFKYKHLGRGEAELSLIRHLVTPGTVALDIGCSIGMYAAEMARHAAKVVAFEANPAVAAFAARVAPRNVEVIGVALSAAPGRARLQIPLNRKGRGISELGTMDPANRRYEGAAVDSVEIEIKRLDDFAISNCSFIKIDVEGHEEAVLDGAARLIDGRPILMVELDEGMNPGTVQRFATRLTALDYQGHFLSRGKLRPIATFDPALYQDQSLTHHSRRTLPAGREYVNNFIFIPARQEAQVLARL
jgi:FkbM family methyltransferase